MSGTGASGYGQWGPTDGSHPYNVNKFIIEQLMNRLVTAKIVQVTAVFGSDGSAVAQADTGQVGPTGTVSVRPLVSLQDGVGNTQSHGIVNGIPFSRVQGGKNAVIMDPQEGDIGIMVVADRDSSAVKSSRAAAAPGSRRKYDIADGMYVCSLLNSGGPAQYVRFRDDGIDILDVNKNEVKTTPAGLTIKDSNGNVSDYSSAGITHTPVGGGMFKVVGNMQVTGTLLGDTDGGGVGLTTHTHNQPNDSHGDTEEPTDAPNIGT